MTVEDLIIELQGIRNKKRQIMILDGNNGGGYPREINLITKQKITKEDAKWCGDCEDMVGQVPVIMGYGFY